MTVPYDENTFIMTILEQIESITQENQFLTILTLVMGIVIGILSVLLIRKYVIERNGIGKEKDCFQKYYKKELKKQEKEKY